MAGENLNRDQNFVTVLGAITNDSAQEVRMVRVDPMSNRVLVSASGLSGGTVTSVSVVSANGFSGIVATATTTPAITIATSITGLLQGNGTTISAVTIGNGISFVGGTLSAAGTSPGGLNTQIQYNNNGVFGSISGATTDGTIVSLTNPLLGGATLTTSSINGVTLTTGGGTTTFLNANGAYSTPAGTISSVSNSDGTLTISPTTGAVVASIALAHANSWTAAQTGLFTGLATTSVDAFIISNTTAAAAGAQQISPSLHWQGMGWKTTATAASQSVDVAINLLPVQGTANATGTLQFQQSIAGGAYTNFLTVTTTGSGIFQGPVLAGAAASGNVAFGSANSSNFVTYNSNVGATNATAMYQFAGSTGVNFRNALGGSISTIAVTAGNNYANTIIASSTLTTAATGTHAWIANLSINTLGTVTGGGATTTNTATVYIGAATTGGTNNYALALAGTTGLYNNIKTAGWGTPAIYGSGRSTAQTAAVASVATYTVGAADGSFLVSANANITAFVAGTFNVTVAYTDETNTAQTLKLNFSSVTGTLGIALAAVGPFEGIPAHIRCKASTAITVATSGTFTSLTYNVEAVITQIT